MEEEIHYSYAGITWDLTDKGEQVLEEMLSSPETDDILQMDPFKKTRLLILIHLEEAPTTTEGIIRHMFQGTTYRLVPKEIEKMYADELIEIL